MRYSNTINCSNCGHFCIPYDQSCSFGGSCDLEPPEPDYYCQKCAEKLEEEHVSQNRIPTNWNKSNSDLPLTCFIFLI